MVGFYVMGGLLLLSVGLTIWAFVIEVYEGHR